MSTHFWALDPIEQPGEAEFKALWDAAMDVIRAKPAAKYIDDPQHERAVEDSSLHLVETMHGIAEVCDVPTVQLTTQVHDTVLAKYGED